MRLISFLLVMYKTTYIDGTALCRWLQLQTSLDATSAMLATCNEDKLKCQVDLAQEKAISSQLSQQLQDAMELLAAEKAAREELTNTIMMVKEASEKVQAEVQRLQLENVQLQQQIAKLRSEQGMILRN